VNGAPGPAQGEAQKCPIGAAFLASFNDRLTLAVWLLITKDAIDVPPLCADCGAENPQCAVEATRPAAFSPPHNLCQNGGSSKPSGTEQ
jgi:hypothetical protein